ncbi:DUF4145 domain-containing protein [Clostridium beijerinckii]|jgi:hypothetical protein|uniref:DUF4145 domain-containing protein n=2 Tax=Clostridium beijerinckii TaxID=1520 RepID=A0AAE2RN34_CLOBE|nr:DUF4145 domain-containing protein [Clostridium beijerinckii]ABR33086.1 hypothetical protein Cbei_0902 [Clostridium beijerinckii NCIMB 8052]AIU01477.1 hypothetical protein Cbs_0902 [Clostridium beijerinckii ATCC 35702]MBF7807231.1 DUF4145 domain-containing protein [Clostridium beijerinckii]NRT25666.1 hypothetical protein [Clostridium beijerinckii]NRT66739.1 hypothetical protein [Clostridium beijerinckii]
MRTQKFDTFEEYEEFSNKEHMRIVDECPICHTKFRVPQGFIIADKEDQKRLLVTECPNKKCNGIFTVRYDYEWSYNNQYKIFKISEYFPYVAQIKIDDKIKKLSPSFYKIYCEATRAKELGLNEICGVGYRKALEFLIKDYCIKNNPDRKEHIEKLFLANVINTYIENDNIKNMADRAVWIGNDETHYVRKWEGNDINDLLKLIDITCYWIVYTEMTKELTDSMSK